MKNLKLVIVTTILMLVVSSHAFAYFNDGNLYQVIYKSDTIERAVDLGSVTSLSGTITTGNGLNLADFGTTAWADLSVGYFAYDPNGTNPYWFAAMNPTAPQTATVSAGFENSYGNVKTTYLNTTNAVVEKPSSTLNGYYKKMDLNGNGKGTYGGFNKTAINPGESPLGNLSQTGGYVDMYLYNFGYNPDDDVFVLNQNGSKPYQAVLRLFANGNVEVNPVPIPASFLLFGSGLLGLFGLKRRNTAVSA